MTLSSTALSITAGWVPVPPLSLPSPSPQTALVHFHLSHRQYSKPIPAVKWGCPWPRAGRNRRCPGILPPCSSLPSPCSAAPATDFVPLGRMPLALAVACSSAVPLCLSSSQPSSQVSRGYWCLLNGPSGSRSL